MKEITYNKLLKLHRGGVLMAADEVDWVISDYSDGLLDEADYKKAFEKATKNYLHKVQYLIKFMNNPEKY